MALHTGAATPQDGDYSRPRAQSPRPAPGRRRWWPDSPDRGHPAASARPLFCWRSPSSSSISASIGCATCSEVEHVFQLAAPGLPADFPPLKSLDRQIHNLPPQLTPFIGREALAAEIRGRLEQPSVRLLTLTGPGGAGKTRLALQVAADLVGEYADGVWFVPLAPVASAALVATTIAGALGVRESAAEPIESISACLSPAETLAPGARQLRARRRRVAARRRPPLLLSRHPGSGHQPGAAPHLRRV